MFNENAIIMSPNRYMINPNLNFQQIFYDQTMHYHHQIDVCVRMFVRVFSFKISYRCDIISRYIEKIDKTNSFFSGNITLYLRILDFMNFS